MAESVKKQNYSNSLAFFLPPMAGSVGLVVPSRVLGSERRPTGISFPRPPCSWRLILLAQKGF